MKPACAIPAIAVLTAFALGLSSANAQAALEGDAASSPVGYSTLQHITRNDSSQVIIQKASRVLPRQNQADWMRLERTFFIHFGPNTFRGVEWGNGHEDPSVFNPTQLDADHRNQRRCLEQQRHEHLQRSGCDRRRPSPYPHRYSHIVLDSPRYLNGRPKRGALFVALGNGRERPIQSGRLAWRPGECRSWEKPQESALSGAAYESYGRAVRRVPISIFCKIVAAYY